MANDSVDSLTAAIRDFQAALTDEERIELRIQSNKIDATEVARFTAEIDRINAKRKTRGVSARLVKVLEAIQWFSDTAESFVVPKTVVSASVFGSVKVFILIASNVLGFFDKLSECFLHVGRLCPRYSEYSTIYVDSKRLQDALAEFYSAIVRFCTKSVQSFRNPVSTLSKALWNPYEKEFGSLEKELDRLRKNVNEEIKLAATQAAVQEYQLQAAERQDSQEHRGFAARFRRDNREWRLEAEARKKKARKQNLLDKLSTHDYMSALKRLRKKRYNLTGSWVCESKGYQDWKNDCKASTVRLSGIVGSGKSVATAALVDDLLGQTRDVDDRLAFFFCENDDTITLKASTILRCIVRQCLTADTMTWEIESKLNRLFCGTTPDEDELIGLIDDVAAAAKLKVVTLVIDGFDECNVGDRNTVLVALKRLRASTTTQTKILISSRQGAIDDIKNALEVEHEISMKCEKADADISTYVTSIVHEKLGSRELRVTDPQLVEDIITTIIASAKGMFLLVAFQIIALCQQKTHEDIQKCLETLPKGLPETFERILLRIAEGTDVEIVAKIFCWVSVARRPLTLAELREAMAVKVGDEFFHLERLVNGIESIVSWCGDLITLDEEDDVVQFSHHTVKRFLLASPLDDRTEKLHFELSSADHTAGETILTYLTLIGTDQRITKTSQTPAVVPAADLLEKVLTQMEIGRPIPQLVKKLTRRTKKGKGLDLMSIFERYNNHEMGRHFQSYATRNWLSHTREFTPDNTSFWPHWTKLIHEMNGIEVHYEFLPYRINTSKDKINDYILTESHCALLMYLYGLNWDCFNDNRQVEQGLMFMKAAMRGETKLVEKFLHLVHPCFLYGTWNLVLDCGDSEMMRLLRNMESSMDNLKSSMRKSRSPHILPHSKSYFPPGVVERFLQKDKLFVDNTGRRSVGFIITCHFLLESILLESSYERLQVVEELSCMCADKLDSQYWETSLQLAASAGSIEAVEILLRYIPASQRLFSERNSIDLNYDILVKSKLSSHFNLFQGFLRCSADTVMTLALKNDGMDLEIHYDCFPEVRTWDASSHEIWRFLNRLKTMTPETRDDVL